MEPTGSPSSPSIPPCTRALPRPTPAPSGSVGLYTGTIVDFSGTPWGDTTKYESIQPGGSATFDLHQGQTQRRYAQFLHGLDRHLQHVLGDDEQGHHRLFRRRLSYNDGGEVSANTNRRVYPDLRFRRNPQVDHIRVERHRLRVRHPGGGAVDFGDGHWRRSDWMSAAPSCGSSAWPYRNLEPGRSCWPGLALVGAAHASPECREPYARQPRATPRPTFRRYKARSFPPGEPATTARRPFHWNAHDPILRHDVVDWPSSEWWRPALCACASRPKPMGPAATSAPAPMAPPMPGDHDDPGHRTLRRRHGPGRRSRFGAGLRDQGGRSRLFRLRPIRGAVRGEGGPRPAGRLADRNIRRSGSASRATPTNAEPANTTSPWARAAPAPSGTTLSSGASTEPGSTPSPTARNTPSTPSPATRPTPSTATPDRRHQRSPLGHERFASTLSALASATVALPLRRSRRRPDRARRSARRPLRQAARSDGKGCARVARDRLPGPRHRPSGGGAAGRHRHPPVRRSPTG